MHKIFHVLYDDDRYEIHYCGQVILRILHMPSHSTEVLEVQLEELDLDLQDAIIEGVLNETQTF